MLPQRWSSAGGAHPDSRRFTLTVGDTALPEGRTCHRKRLCSVGEDDEAEARRRSCALRPNPEGSLSANELSCYGEEAEPGEELRTLCQRCHIMASQLHRQAASLADATALKDPAYASFLFDKFQRLQWPCRGRNAPVDAHCDVCGASFQRLRFLALRRALGLSRETTPCPSTLGAPPTSPGYSPIATLEEDLSAKQQSGGGALWGWGGVQSTYLGGGGAKRLATVTPLPLNTNHYLEGVWRVTSHGAEFSSPLREYLMKSSTQSVGTQTSRPPSAAVSFFMRATQKLSMSRRKRSQPGHHEAPGPLLYTGGFSEILQLAPPPLPQCLHWAGSKVKDTPGTGKVRVMVRLSMSSESVSFLKVDGRKLNLYEPLKPSSAPRTFVLDAVFSQNSSQAEVCSGAVVDVVRSVVGGADGCIFSFGHANLGKTYTMIGRDCSSQFLGVAPTAISWLFKVMEERQEKTAAGFCVRVSALEISGREEALTDLLAEVSQEARDPPEARGPEVSLRNDPVCGSQLQNETELRASSAEQAAFFLDAALAARRSTRVPGDQEVRRNSHFLFTLHLHQQRADKNNKAAVSGRSRLHLLDLGSCEVGGGGGAGGAAGGRGGGGGGRCLSLSALGHVLLALASGARHVPYRDSKLTMLLRESLGNINCRSTMIVHVSDSPRCFMETLSALQLASNLHRTRRSHNQSSSGWDTSCKEPLPPLTRAPPPEAPHSDPDHCSSILSCDRVVYVAPRWAELSDRVGPPPSVSIIPSLIKRKRVTDRNPLRCNTFAELQEKLDGIDTSTGSGHKSDKPAKREKTSSGDPEPGDKVFLKSSSSSPRTSQLNPAAGQRFDFLREVPLQQVNEDQLVFTVGEEELPSAGLQVSASRPVSIISSINDEYDVFPSHHGLVGPGAEASPASLPDPVGSWSRDVDPADTESNTAQVSQPHETNSDPPTRASLRSGTKLRSGTLNPAQACLLEEDTLTSPAGDGCTRQEVVSHFGQPAVRFFFNRKPTRSTSCQRSGGSSAPNPSEAPPSSDHRLLDVCGTSCSRREETMKLLRLGRGFAAVSDLQSSDGTRRFTSWRKKSKGQKSVILRSGSEMISAPSDQPEMRTAPPSGEIVKSSITNPRHVCLGPRMSSLRTDRVSEKTRTGSGSLMNLQKCESPTFIRHKGFTASGGNFRSSRSVPASTSDSSKPHPGVLTSKGSQVRGRSSRSSKLRTSSHSRGLSSAHNPADNATRSGSRMGHGTVMGTRQAVSRVRDLQGPAGSHVMVTAIPSPYSKVTPPRGLQRYSSDNSSVLSGELPPAMGSSALLYHSGGSSGYESMIQTGQTTSAGGASGTRTRVSKPPRKRGPGFLRRHLIPALLPDTSSLGRKWAELAPVGGGLKEPFEIKVYEIDDVELLQKRKEAESEKTSFSLQPFHDVEKGLMFFTSRLRKLERRQLLLSELRSRHRRLEEDLQEAQRRLMLPPDKWSGEFDVDPDLEQESQEYLEALVLATADLELCVNLCKSRVMMETCFDITMTTERTAGGHAW